MFNPVNGYVSAILLTSTLLSLPVQADSTSGSRDGVYHWSQFSFENDAISLINKSDDGYSNGLFYTWGSKNYADFEAIAMPQWIRYLSENSYINQGAAGKYALDYGVSQLMYTPDELEASELVSDDRPYAGTLLWSAKLRQYGNDRANSLGLSLGVIGPASLAEVSQKVIHKAIGATTPEGWDHQIDNEPVFRVEGEHVVRMYTRQFSHDLAFDTSSYSEAGLGNLRSDIGTGISLRYGHLLQETYASINPTSSADMSAVRAGNKGKLYWQTFATLYASYVFNDITFDGNTFKDSHSVPLINEQVILTVGAGVLYNNWGMVFSIHRGNDQFEGQKTISKYGSMTISYRH